MCWMCVDFIRLDFPSDLSIQFPPVVMNNLRVAPEADLVISTTDDDRHVVGNYIGSILAIILMYMMHPKNNLRIVLACPGSDYNQVIKNVSPAVFFSSIRS